MPEIQTDETPRSRRIAESVGFDDDGMNMLDQIEAAANNDGGYTDFDATVVYATARVAGIPVKPREVVRDLPGVDADDLVRDTRRLVDPLPFDISVEDPIAFVDRYVDEFDETMRIPDGFRMTARDLCRASTDAGIHSGKSPSGFAAAVVYAASEVDGVGLRQTQIGDVADVTNMTIRKMYRDVIDAADADSMTPSRNDIPDLVERIADAIDRVPDAVADDASRLASRLATSDAASFAGRKPKASRLGRFTSPPNGTASTYP